MFSLDPENFYYMYVHILNDRAFMNKLSNPVRKFYFRILLYKVMGGIIHI